MWSKLKIKWFGLFVFLFILAGCGSSPVKEDSARVYDVDECAFPDFPTQKAPEWVCNEKIDGIEVASVGTYGKTKAGLSFQEQQASTSARVKLAQQLQVQVQNMIKQFAETSGLGDSETVDRVNTSVTKQITDQKIAGSRILKKIVAPNGTLYVLVGIDSKQLKTLTKQAVISSMSDEQALWQQFKAKQGFEELADEISNQKTSEN